MREITRNPLLLRIRNDLVKQLKQGGKIEISLERSFFIEEIGEIFRLRKSRISQILNEKDGSLIK